MVLGSEQVPGLLSNISLSRLRPSETGEGLVIGTWGRNLWDLIEQIGRFV